VEQCNDSWQGARVADPCNDIRKLETLAALSEQQQARLTRLTEDLSKNPATAAAEQRLKADRIKRLREVLSTIEEKTADAVVNSLCAQQRDATAKQEAAQLAAQGLFATDPLPDVGGEVWRNLWEAARRYSTEVAYPAAPFPPIEPDARCLLCQQPLTPDAAERLSRFDVFIQDDTKRQADIAAGQLNTTARTLRGLTISLRPIADTLKEVALHDRALARAIRRALASARLHRYTALSLITGNETVSIPPAQAFPGEAITRLGAELTLYATELQKAATADERKALEAERQELSDKATLHTHMPTIRTEIARLQ
jgi:hypothetical protein